eukprot:TRINITY_DN20650_c0_g1_i1.p1 TRINITY_DN20650_c0_g1~~TRINITY_DN20650_c0_g1_i1.p1  ORF type:complete len:464 (+),score=54.35 TRINITY_DN20650_c0_g1_i1:112-1503(+)
MASQSKMWACGGIAALAFAAVPCVIKASREGTKKADKADFDFEFGGPVGAYATMVALPGVIFFLYYTCGKDFVVPGVDLRTITRMRMPEMGELLSWKAVGIYTGWFTFQVLLERALPGQVIEGTDLALAGATGRLKYKMNGHLAFWVSMAALACFRGRLSVLYDEFPALAGASILFSTGMSACLYFRSFSPGALFAKGGNSGNAVYDFFIGRELNPRIGSFDLKEFCELRPGLIGWVALNLGMSAKQYQGASGVSGSMLLVNLLQGLYVWDSLYHEQAILSTMDITTDGFGFMLAFGDLAWVPFTYGLQARYLVDHDPGLSPWMLSAIACGGLGGYAIFRASNSQKDQFRRDPSHASVKDLEVMKATNLMTGRVSQLLVSGWWGLARKINYTGDWLMAWAWSMTTGCPAVSNGSVMTYFYPIYFAVLLIHRASRDDHFCSQKYGEAWREYKKRVPYLFVPYLF